MRKFVGSQYLGEIHVKHRLQNHTNSWLKRPSLSLKNNVKTFNNIHLLVLFVYFILVPQVCMDDNFILKGDSLFYVNKLALFTSFETDINFWKTPFTLKARFHVCVCVACPCA